MSYKLLALLGPVSDLFTTSSRRSVLDDEGIIFGQRGLIQADTVELIMLELDGWLLPTLDNVGMGLADILFEKLAT